ncbi:type VI secretion system tube protein Hcp, partial [Escherichia coli]
MGDIVYLRIIGEKQGDISSGCGTYAAVGNRWQVGHEDEIFAFALTNAITSTG